MFKSSIISYQVHYEKNQSRSRLLKKNTAVFSYRITQSTVKIIKYITVKQYGTYTVVGGIRI